MEEHLIRIVKGYRVNIMNLCNDRIFFMFGKEDNAMFTNQIIGGELKWRFMAEDSSNPSIEFTLFKWVRF